ncbi:MAG: metalloregulator ArsR/SmtB family transcription factor [Cytophagaceae bacterium]|jgi:ArsR family transcriptional regulator|nr:metalloregulator ArsR/SmtB family transcription factor [Cytophagaceae bacterium]
MLAPSVKIFKALSDESRLRIVHLLIQTDEMCISDLEVILDYSQTKTSRHLAYLRNLGVVDYTKIDQWVYYKISAAYVDTITPFLKWLGKDPILYKDLLEYRTLYTNNELAIRKLHIRKKVFKLPEL